MKSRQQSGKVRIIGGQWRGRKLAIAELEGLRPSTDRVRETLFNWLQPIIEGSTCLDLYAGTGALGFEAASRGAAQVDLVEKNRQVAAVLQAQKAILSAQAVDIFEADALRWLSACRRTYDVIFLDPPFSQDYLPGCLEVIIANGLLKTGGMIYVESGKPDLQQQLVAGLRLLKSKKAGQVYYGLVCQDSDRTP